MTNRYKVVAKLFGVTQPWDDIMADINRFTYSNISRAWRHAQNWNDKKESRLKDTMCLPLINELSFEVVDV